MEVGAEKEEYVAEMPKIEEDEVYENLLQICSGKTPFTHRIVRAGAYRHSPLKLHHPPLFGRWPRFNLLPDPLAHQLTLPVAPNVADSVRHLVLLPEFTATNDCFLTHLYLPTKKILACQLYPIRLDTTVLSASNSRLPINQGQGGLLDGVLASLQHCASKPKQVFSQNNGPLHKFVAPKSALEPEEILLLEEIHETYRNKLYAPETG